MRTLLAALSIALVTTAACSYKALAPGEAAAHPPAPRGALLATWEHYCVYPQNEFDTVLAEAGAAGCEMVCFKRPLAPAPPLPATSPPPSVTPPAPAAISPGAAGS